MPPKFKNPDSTKKLHRLIAILRKLDNRERMTANTLADEFSVSKRTALRDIKDLNESGFAICFVDEQGTYRFVDPDYTFRDLDLNENELMVLFLGKQMARGLGKPLEAAALSLIKKASKETGDKTGARAKKLDKENRFWVGLDYGEDFAQIEGQYNAVNAAMDRKVEMEITYVAMNTRKETQRAIAPYGLIFKYGIWYVLGYCHLREDIRLFALDCIKDLRLTDKSYRIPDDFDIDNYFEAGWNMLRYGKPIEVVLRFTKEYARWIQRRKWHPTQVIEEKKDGSIIFRVTVEGTEELKWWTYHWIPFCEIISPPELKKEVMDEMKAMMKEYGE